MKKRGTLIVVDDNKNILTSLQYLLDAYFDNVVTLGSPVTLPTSIRQYRPEVVLLDMNFSSGQNLGNEGLYWLREIKRMSPNTQVVLFTAYADIDLAVRGLKDGATDFVVKPWDNTKLVRTLLDASDKALAASGAKTSRGATQPEGESQEMYWGTSAAMLALKLTVEKVSTTDATVLITGENGTGKDMLAHEIHRLSPRCNGPFVAVDMGAITETLFESELFGHVKGSFTDAVADRVGRFEAASGGTLFLDEIANLPLHMQPKLLTAIQKRSFVKVGSNTPQPTNIRLVCATNQDLNRMVAEGTFREDLLYRINTIHLHLPPLRERTADIVPLATMFMKKYSTQYGRSLETLSPETAAKLRQHPWHGNIRELQHVMEKAVILSDGTELQPDAVELNAVVKSPDMPETNEATQTLEQMEEDMVRRAISQCDGNLSAAAHKLGVSRQTLYNKMKRYGI